MPEVVIDENSPTMAQLAVATLDQVPLVWTTIGNVPKSELEYRHGWQLHVTDAGGLSGMVFWEEYWFNGELVQRSAHVYKHEGVAGEGQAATIPQDKPAISH
jgi:hypothetical protein